MHIKHIKKFNKFRGYGNPQESKWNLKKYSQPKNNA